MQHIEEIEDNLRKALDYIDKIKILSLLVAEDKAYLTNYYKTAWYVRPPKEYAESKVITQKNREQKIAEYEKKYKSVMAEIISYIPQKTIVAVAELNSPWI
jgi:hypothetical protein